MPAFSNSSRDKLSTCRPELRALFNEVVLHFDCTIIEGVRGRDAQEAAVAAGNSQLHWPNGKHNVKTIGELSSAVDVAPYPIDWGDRERMTLFAGYVKGVAQMMGIRIRWGGDWDGDTEVKDNRFDDLVHFELVD